MDDVQKNVDVILYDDLLKNLESFVENMATQLPLTADIPRFVAMPSKHTALYYPHIAIENEGLLKNALLLWDNVELICPFGQFPREPNGSAQRDAFAVIARPLQPSEEDRKNAHDALIELADSDLPDWFFPEHVNENLRYTIYPGKFMPETWEALQQTKLARPKVGDIDPPMPFSTDRAIHEDAQPKAFETTEAFGLTMLSVLADCCAGATKQLVTDETDSYVALDNYLKLISGAKKSPLKRSPHDRLVTLSLSVADLSGVDLGALVRVRQKEDEKPNLRQMRHNYVARLDTYIDRLSTQARNRGDIAEIERLFQEEVADDISLLKEELKDEANRVIFSKEMAAAAVAVGWTFVEPVSGSVGTAGALYRAKLQYRTARNRTLANHAMSWLYEARNCMPLY